MINSLKVRQLIGPNHSQETDQKKNHSQEDFIIGLKITFFQLIE